MSLPRALCIHPASPYYPKGTKEQAAAIINAVDKVYVNGVHLPNCFYYNKDKGEARALDAKRNWLPMQHGSITVTEKGNPIPSGAIDLFNEAGKYIGDEPFKPSDPADFL